MCGTPEYAAPDIFKGEYDEKCDIWSFGVLLYVLMSATFPFRGESREETIALIEKGTFTFHSEIWNTISAEAKEFISRLLTK
jgi:calcium-dependent protein kinase